MGWARESVIHISFKYPEASVRQLSTSRFLPFSLWSFGFFISGFSGIRTLQPLSKGANATAQLTRNFTDPPHTEQQNHDQQDQYQFSGSKFHIDIYYTLIYNLTGTDHRITL